MKLLLQIILIFISSNFSIFSSELSFYSISLKVFPLEYDLYVNDQIQESFSNSNNIQKYLIPIETDSIFIRSMGYRDKYFFYNDSPGSDPLEIKMERVETALLYQDMVNTGSQPKSVEFSKDGKYLAVALLNGKGVEIYSPEDMELLHILNPPIEWSEKKGFVETVFFTSNYELWVSQMTTGMIHVFDTQNWKYKLSFDCGGSWPKVITLNKDEDTAYISNWISKNISVINTSDYSVKKTISVNGIPRGMAISPDENFLYVGNFTSGDINKIDIKKKTVVKNIDLGDGALRHIVISEKDNKIYVSDMLHGSITVLDLKTDSIERSFYAGSNINTIKLSADSSKLYISSRGHNSENGYLQKGPELGKILVYDTKIKKINDWTWGGNQPTGLSISPNGTVLAFTDFLDHRVEIYSIQP